MGHTCTNLMVHGVFSTKHRQRFLTPEIMPELIKVVGGILRKRDSKLLAMNGVEDHVHLLAIFHPARSTSDLFRDMKAVSSNWIHETFPPLTDFAWQTGYGAFSVSKSSASQVEQYIASQREHHRQQTFQEEFVALLDRHGIEYDPRYVLD